MSFFTEAADGGDYVKFDDSTVGQPIAMEITGQYKRQWSMYDKEYRRDGKGNLVEEAVVPVRVDGEDKQLSINAWRMRKAVGNAVKLTHAPDLEIGGVLTITYTGKEKALKGGGTAKTYAASYKRAPEGSAPATPANGNAPLPLPETTPPQADSWGGSTNPWG